MNKIIPILIIALAALVLISGCVQQGQTGGAGGDAKLKENSDGTTTCYVSCSIDQAGQQFCESSGTCSIPSEQKVEINTDCSNCEYGAVGCQACSTIKKGNEVVFDCKTKSNRFPVLEAGTYSLNTQATCSGNKLEIKYKAGSKETGEETPSGVGRCGDGICGPAEKEKGICPQDCKEDSGETSGTDTTSAGTGSTGGTGGSSWCVVGNSYAGTTAGGEVTVAITGIETKSFALTGESLEMCCGSPSWGEVDIDWYCWDSSKKKFMWFSGQNTVYMWQKDSGICVQTEQAGTLLPAYCS